MPVWDPLLQQFAEADTLFKPSFANQPTINAEGGFLQGSDVPQADLVSRYDFGAGKFTPAIRAKAGQASYVFYPIDGLIAGDEFTLEYWQKLDISWASHNSGKALFALQGSTGGNALQLLNIFNGTATTFANTMTNVPARAWSGSWSPSVASLGLVDGVFNNFAITLKTGVLTFYVNGVQKGTITGVNYLPIWSDSTKEEGVCIGGEPGANNNIWTSDVRISYTARVPGQTPTLRSLNGSMAVSATSTSGSLPTNFAGSLYMIRNVFNSETYGAMHAPDAIAAIASVRATNPFTDTPVKAGGTDASHPTLGASGLFSYDWQVVDRSLQWWTDRGLEKYGGIDGPPTVLGGGQIADPVLHRLIGGTATGAVPSSFADYATIAKDLVAHANANGRHFDRLGAINEPDSGSGSWAGTTQQLVDLWATWVAAVRALDGTIKLGAGEIATVYSTAIIDAYMAKSASSGVAMDFFGVHDYDGTLTILDQMKGLVAKYAGDHSLSTPPISISEHGWSNRNDQQGVQRFRDTYYHVRALGAAYYTAYKLHALDLGGIDKVLHHGTGPAFGTIRSGIGYTTMILVGTGDDDDIDEHWATYNAMKGWKTTLHNRDILTTTKALPPGVYGIAAKDPAATKYGFAFANWGYANRNSRTVNVTISNLPAGNYRLRRYLVDETHSSRWDVAQDNPVGAEYDALATVEDRTDTAANLAAFAVTLPRWSSTFITIEPATGPGIVSLAGTSNGSSSSSGSLTVFPASGGGNVPLGGVSVGTSTSSGSLSIVGTALAGTSVGSSSSSGTLRVSPLLLGTSIGSSTSTGTLLGGTAPTPTLTGELGTSDSWLSNIVLGYPSEPSLEISLTGTSTGFSTTSGVLGLQLDPPGIDLPTPLVLDNHVTTLSLKGNETEMSIDGD